MSILPEYVEQWFADFMELTQVTLLSGGDSNHVALVHTTERDVIVKWKANAPLHFFLHEAEGLLALRRTKTLRVPDVITIGDYQTPFLILEYIPPIPVTDERVFTQRFAEGLAELHCHTENFGRFGWPSGNFLGSQPQPNGWLDTWPDFYRTRRLLPQWDKARGRRLFPAHRERLLSQVAEQLDTLLDYDARPVLIHGDLWSGNFLSTTNDQPVLIDPAVHYADREVELAFVELFGGFPRGFVRAYDSAYPLNEGYARRRALHQLYPLLVHLNHFGETYGPSVDRACVDALG